MPRIAIDNLTFGYQKKQPLFDSVSLNLEAHTGSGKIIAMVGRSGSGKSTLLKLILGLTIPWSGEVKTLPSEAQAAFLPQEPIIFEHLSTLQNVYYFQRIRATSKRIRTDHVDHLAEDLKMKDIMNSSQGISDLSGGERQRVSLLRALSVEPDILCLDEPCSGLDVGVKREFLISLRDAAQRHGILTLYVTHHADEALMIADEVIFIDREGPSKTKVYGGSISGMLEKPPVIAIRTFFGGATLNTLRCSISSGLLQIPGTVRYFGRLTHELDLADCLITFPPEAVRVGVDGVPLRVRATSGRLTFCEILQGGESVRMIGPRLEGTSHFMTLEGMIDIFTSSGVFVQSGFATKVT